MHSSQHSTCHVQVGYTFWICIVYTILIWQLWSTYSRSFFSANGCILFKVIKALISKEWHYVRHCIYYLYYTYKHKYIPRVVKPHLWKLEKEGHGACLRKCTHHPTLLLHLCVCMLAWRSQYYQEDPVPSSNGNHHHLFVCMYRGSSNSMDICPKYFCLISEPKNIARNCDNFTIR